MSTVKCTNQNFGNRGLRENLVRRLYKEGVSFHPSIYSILSMLKDEALIYFSNENIILGTMSKFMVTN